MGWEKKIRLFVKYKQWIYELAVRDLKLRYRKPFLGFLWMLIIPLCSAIIYKLLFSDFFQITTGRYPYFIYLLTSLLPWAYFSSSLQGSVKSILESKDMISQVAFPKYLLPVSAVFANLLNFLPTILILICFLAAYGIKIATLIICLPLVILIHTCLIVGLSLLVSSLQVICRDVEYIVQVVITVLFYLTPSVYTLDELIGKGTPLFIKIYMYNPLVGILNLYRITFISGYSSDLPPEVNYSNTIINPILWAVAVLFIGYKVFKKTEGKFYDYINV